MKKLLNLSIILPFPEEVTFKYGLVENDYIVLLSKRYADYESYFLRPSFFCPKFLGFFRKKWQAFNEIPSAYDYKGDRIDTIKHFGLPKNMMPRLFDYLSYLIFGKAIKKYKNIDVVHAQDSFIEWLLAYKLYKLYKIPYVLTLRNNINLYSFPFKRITKKIINNASYLTTPNYSYKLDLEKIIKREILLIPHGFDFKNSYKSFGVNSVVEICVVSRLLPLKRIDLVLRALSDIDPSLYHLTVVGDGEEYSKLDLLSKELNINASFTGRVENSVAMDYLKGSDIFVLPSVYEAFGRAYIEAMATSNAVIAVKDTGIWGFFSEDEVLYTEKNSLPSLKKALTSLLFDREKIMKYKEKGYNAVSSRFDWDSISIQYKALYDKSLKNERN